MNNRKLISKLSDVISILGKLVSELANNSSHLTSINNDENITILPKIHSKKDRFERLADLLNNEILKDKITVRNPRISTSDLLIEIMKYPEYKPKNEEEMLQRRGTLKQYLYKIKSRKLLNIKYKVEKIRNENYYFKEEEKNN